MVSIVIETLPGLTIALAFAGFLSGQTCDTGDVACAQAGSRVEEAVQADPALAEIAGYAKERRDRIISYQTAPAAEAMARDERRFTASLSDLLDGEQFEGRNRYLALGRLRGRWRSLDRMNAAADRVNGYWENSAGAVWVERSGPGKAGVTVFQRREDSLVEHCRLEGLGETGGTELSLALRFQESVQLRVHDGALWVHAYDGGDDCARTMAASDVYFSASPEIQVPSP